MDSSSPLAAMRPAPAPAWGQSSHHCLPSRNPFASGNMGIREQLHRTRPDYFSFGSVRGSSPGASLAADLSQNFRLDSEDSPRFPTPRRALFTSKMMEAIEKDAQVKTPPLPATSSPVPMDDSMDMDMSPLPQKESFFSSFEIASPTPQVDDEDDMMIMDSPLLTRQPSGGLEPSKVLFDSRKRAGIRRPSLTRTKVHTTSSLLTTRLHPESQISSFRFGSETRFGASTSSGMSPGDCFEDSPLQDRDRRPQTANSPSPTSGVSRPKPRFSGLNATQDIRNGSPIPSHVRRLSNPFARSRRPYRRSLSMFDSPDDVIKASSEEPVPQSTLQAVMDVEEPQDPMLPHFFPDGESDNIPRISKATFLDVMDGKFNECYTQKMIIDCRFEYEYDGGHIETAVNYNDKELLTRQLFENPMGGKTLLIFHCEYSACRAPMMARHVRASDRMANAECYPRLTYPEVYILDGGYSEFFIEHRDRCYPQAYVAMGAEEHANTCEREMGKLQQKRKGLGRAKTFAFGHRDSMVDASPTAPTRRYEHDSPIMMIGNSPILGHSRSPRRMASY
ncbi:Rhodanese-like protein [Annulohypoxylon maeteangense]|uniref:Rhodanese-like protein n=1 Tax=Annulohypoxylon maeteangense TaxID=1927788 RepID=UPI002008A71E|nr:Rhodanese-like protein [Annulohypoxylon maeteangense]KAI0889624.1 Rhodanese-like protein [Annulohypoxylon maeteangense]